jgi:glycosyltransferase involved in cell wall biosynthesis
MAEKLNILYVFGGEKAQGAEIVIERLMFYNAEKFNIHLILSPGEFADNLIKEGKPYKITLLKNLKKLNRANSGKARYYLKGIGNYFSVSAKVYSYIKKNRIDIVHANTVVPASYLLPLIAYARTFLPSVKWYWSDHDLKYFSKLDSMLSRCCGNLYTKTLVVSNAVRNKYETANANIVVLYNGLNVDEFKPDSRKRIDFREKLAIGPDIITIGIAASINPDKGQLELIQVFNKLCEIYPGTRLVIAGGFAGQFPAYAEKVKAAIKTNQNIIYVGFIKDVMSFYNGCDVVINNSNNYRSESLGTTIYEAMACEKIVTAANTGGTPEIIDDKNNGFLFAPENIDDLYNKLSDILNRYQSLDVIRKAARDKVIDKFNIVKMVDNYNKILME